MTPASIRLGTDADVAAVLELWALADAVPSVTDDETNVRRAVQHEVLLVACEGERLVGTLIATFDGWRGNMYRLAIDPAHRRRGLAVGSSPRASGGSKPRAAAASPRSVVAAEDHATSFWPRAGYELDERIARYVKTTRA